MKMKKLLAGLLAAAMLLVNMPVKVEATDVETNAVSSSEELAKAIEDGETNITLNAGTYHMPAAAKGKTLTLTGTSGTSKEDVIIEVVPAGQTEANGQLDYNLDGSTVTFNNLTIKTNNQLYAGYARLSGTYNNCIIQNTYNLGTGNSAFYNCTFNITNEYLRVGGATTAVFENCTFNTDGRAILVYQDGTNVEQTVTVKDCTFNATAAAHTWNGIHVAAVSIDSTNGTYEVNLEGNNIVDSDFNGLSQIKAGEANVTVTVSPIIEVSTADELIEVMTETTVKPVKYKNLTIEIMNDIDVTGKTWVSGFLNGYDGAGTYTINGNNHTLKGLTDALIDGTWAGEGELIINDLTIADSTITGGADSHGLGAFVGHSEATQKVELNNCHLLNSSVTGADWTGGLIGYAAGYNKQNDGPVKQYMTIKDCSVKNSTITGAGSTGAVFGHATGNAWTWIAVDNIEVEGNTIVCTDDSDMKAGSIMGTVGIGEVTVNNATVKGNTVTSNNVANNRIAGRNGSGGSLVVNGGKFYDSLETELLPTDMGSNTTTGTVLYKDDLATPTYTPIITTPDVEAEGVDSGEEVDVDTTTTVKAVKDALGRKNILATIEVGEADDELVEVTYDAGRDYKNETIYVLQWDGEEFTLVDTVEADKRGDVVFTVEGDAEYILSTVLPEETEEPETPVVYGWVETEEGWKFYDYATGEQRFGWVADGKNWYFINKETGIMLENDWIAQDSTGAVWYYVGADGAMVRDVTVDGYYIDANGEWRA